MKRIVLCLLILSLCLPSLALAASFTIPENTIAVDVQPDGSGLFEETIVYDFEDDYNGILATLRHEDVTLSNLRLFVDGNTELSRVETMDKTPFTYTAITSGNQTEIQAYAPGGEGTRTFRITYRIDGLALRYQDTARINYVFVKSETELEGCTLRITLPGTADGDILTYVHGALSSQTPGVQRGVITVGPGKVGEDKAVELDILFPEAWLPDALIIPEDMREKAIAQEAEIVARAAQQARTVTIVLLVLLGVYALGFLFLFIRMMRKYGLKHQAVPTTDPALLDSIPAALAQVLLDGNVSSSALSATLLELVDQGVLAVEAEGEDIRFTLVKAPLSPAAHESALLQWLFPQGEPFYINSLDAEENVEAAKQFNAQYNAWKQQVVQETRDRGWLFANDTARWSSILLAPLVGIALGAFLLRIGLWPLAILAGVLAVLFLVAFLRIRRLTDEGEARVNVLTGFRLNYADLLERDPQSILGHTPLVMALGYLQSLADWIDRRPDGFDSLGWDVMPTYWAYAGWHHSMLRMDETVREAQSHNAGIESSGGDSSGSGGGFSGGSGGGSSYGAW